MRPGPQACRRIFGAHAAHLRAHQLRCSLTHNGALAALLVDSPESGPPGSPNLSPTTCCRASSAAIAMLLNRDFVVDPAQVDPLPSPAQTRRDIGANLHARGRDNV